ncbi:methyltransferase domain-containing protein [Aeromicrobium stalagmiti]|uniref:methyltransferase domain-containing protein n=1 Tax=Aeromicrobium stalagmiti TaxID=2738988 RepID=UPI001569188B|nr:methyltransferase domain-containing protein [Aeromicrobium stalagmiti]NRQ48243.1 methyltransferase domain-containing protein [Aeromicrobium stalagmiti]
MPTWDPTRYLQFADDRSRPFVDLVARVQSDAETIVDLGCGPGHLTEVLRARWPDAAIHGVDSSAEMIDRATGSNDDPATTYELADVSTWSPDAPVDLVVSNALFQWVPDQLDVIGRLADHVAPRGTFALQVPRNYDSPSHTLLRDIASEAAFAEHTSDIRADRGTDPVAYLDLFTDRGWDVDLWETTYFHVLDGDDPVLDWVSGTGARPYLQALPDDLRDAFVAAYRAALREAYPRRTTGTVFPFRRTFVVARRRD